MVTRLYFPFTTPAIISPAFDSGWEDNNEAVRRLLNHVKGNSALADGSSIVYLSTQDGLDRQYISYPMNKGISFSAATVKMQIMTKESNAGDDATSRLGVRILSRDGATVRATLLAVQQWGPETEYITTNRNKTFADGDTVAGTYETVDGDRLCVEIGHSDTIDLGTTIAVTCNFGEVGTDLAENETATSGNGWIEFSNTITFQPEAIPQPYIYKQYQPQLSKERKEEKRGRRTSPRFSAWQQILPVASIPLISYSINVYQKYLTKWREGGKITRRLAYILPKFDSWKSIFVGGVEPDFTSIQGDIQIVKSGKRLTKYFARRYSRLRELLPVPSIPTTIEPKQFYQKYKSSWSKKAKRKIIRVTPTPDYTLWENLLKLFRREISKPKKIYRKREPVLRPTPQFKTSFNLIKLLRSIIQKPKPIVSKKEPVLRIHPRFDSWKAIFVAVVALPLINYPYSFYQKYLSVWNKKRKSQVRGHPITPKYSAWGSFVVAAELIGHLVGSATGKIRLKAYQWTQETPHSPWNKHRKTRDT